MLCPNCVAETLFGEPSANDFSAPERIGPFDLMEQLGEGAFGVVYHALQTEPVQREVALKVLKPGMDSKQIISRFEAERQALAVMDHPDISTVYAAGQTEEGRPYFAMELVIGLPLTEFCSDHELDLRSRLGLFVRICGAIEHAHQKGIIHRDLKPNNILVGGSSDAPEPKVIDFGIAKATEFLLTDSTLMTGGGQLLGTPEYMSPEQATLGKAEVDTRADVYALGMVLYELLAGAPAWTRETLGDLQYDEFLRMIREAEPRPPSSRQPRLPADLDWIVLKAIDKDRRRRYGSAAAFADDISRFLNHEPIRARPPSSAYRVTKFVRKHRVGVVFCSLLAGSLIAGATVAAVFAVRAGRERVVAERERVAAEDLRAESKREFSRADLRIANEISATGRHSAAIAHLCRALRNDPENRPAMQKLVNDLAYRGFPIPAASPIQIGSNWNGSVLLADDRLAILGTDSRVAIWSLEDQTERMQVEFPPAKRLVAAAGGELIALELEDGGEWELFGFDGELVTKIEASFGIVTMSADGERLVGTVDSGIRCFDCRTGEVLWDLQDTTAVTALSAAMTGGTVAVGFEDGRILILFSDGKVGLERQLPENNPVRFLKSARGAVLAASDGRNAYLWSRKGSEPLVMATSGDVSDVAMSRDSDVAVVVAGKSLRIYDGEEVMGIELGGEVKGIDLAPDSRAIYAAHMDGSVSRVDTKTAESLGAPFKQRQPVAAMHFVENQVVAVTGNGSLHRWERRSQIAKIARFDHDGKSLIWAAFHLSSSSMSTGTVDGRINFWWSNGRHMFEVDGTRQIPFNYTADGKLVFYNHVTTELSVRNSISDVKGQPMKLRIYPLAAEIDDEATIAVASLADGSVSLWDVGQGELLHRWESLAGKGAAILDGVVVDPAVPAVRSRHHVYVSDDAKYAAVANGGDHGYILELTPPYRVTQLSHSGQVRWMTIDPLKQKVATGAADNSARVWAFPSGEPLTPYLFHEESCPDSGIIAEFSHDGSQLVTGGSFDSTARVWDIASGEMRIDPLQHPGVVNAINISPDSRNIATGSSDGVRLWDADTGAAIAPLWDMGAPVPELFFEPGAGLRLFAYNTRGECSVFEIVPRDFAMEAWFLDFAEALGGLRFNERDVLVPTNVTDLKEWERRLARVDRTAGSPCEQFAQWLVSPSGERDTTPFRRYWDVGGKMRPNEELEELEAERRRRLEGATSK